MLKDKQTHRFRLNRLSVTLLSIGVLLCASPIAGKLYTNHLEDRMLEEWLNSAEAEPTEAVLVDPEEAYAQLRDAFDSEAADTSDGQTDPDASSIETSSDADSTGMNESTGDGGVSLPAGSGNTSSGTATPDQKVLGILQINKIKVKEPIVEGVGKSNLRSGIGHIPGTAALGQAGNCALAGHRNYAFKKFFRRLDELEPGDEIIISTKKEDLKYTVNGKKVVTPEDVSVLSGSKDESIISLITCTPVYVASHRLIVTAELTGRTLREP